MSKPYPIVMVRWIDSASHRGWYRPDELKGNVGIVEIVSIGFLVQETPSHISISTCETSEHRSSCDPLAIPRGAILARRYLSRRILQRVGA